MAVTTGSAGIAVRKPAETSVEIHPLLRERWSPRAFSDRSLELDQIKALLEAARWSPSSRNEQPWRFIVARREDRGAFEKILSVLVESNQVWAKNAPMLLLAVSKAAFDDGLTVNRHAAQDAGLALGNLVVQASALGLYVHMMAGFGAEKARDVFHIPTGYEPLTAAAVGYLGDSASLPDRLRERELAPRVRKPLEEIVFSGTWGEAAFRSPEK
jgi:nitroreductase